MLDLCMQFCLLTIAVYSMLIWKKLTFLFILHRNCEPVTDKRFTTINFKFNHCYPTKANDAEQFFQIKRYDGQYFVYCYGNTIKIGPLNQPCPREVLILPEFVDFYVNNQYLKANHLRFNYKVSVNSILSTKVNRNLMPKANMSVLFDKFDVKADNTGAGRNMVYENNGHIVHLVCVLTGCFVFGFVIIGFMYWRSRRMFSVQRENPRVVFDNTDDYPGGVF